LIGCVCVAVISRKLAKVHAAPGGTPWMWTLAFGRTPRSHGYATTREAAIAAFAKSWRWE
jgi:hypothetical protein